MSPEYSLTFPNERFTSGISARTLLAAARALYDDPSLPFASSASRDAWKGGFDSGADWMRLVLGHLRGEALPPVDYSFHRLGLIKYSLAAAGAIIVLLISFLTRLWPLIVLVVPVFYGIEAQMVFLFPVALDGNCHIFRLSRQWTIRAGGTLHVMWIVIGLAVTMIFGGFVGRGFVRSWALGCLAVLLWYEQVRIYHAAA